MEQEALRKRVQEVECGKPMVMALGGGAFVDPVESQDARGARRHDMAGLSFPAHLRARGRSDASAAGARS